MLDILQPPIFFGQQNSGTKKIRELLEQLTKQKTTQTTELHENASTWPLLGTTTKNSGKLILVQQFQSAVKGGNISESVVSM